MSQKVATKLLRYIREVQRSIIVIRDYAVIRSEVNYILEELDKLELYANSILKEVKPNVDFRLHDKFKVVEEIRDEAHEMRERILEGFKLGEALDDETGDLIDTNAGRWENRLRFFVDEVGDILGEITNFPRVRASLLVDDRAFPLKKANVVGRNGGRLVLMNVALLPSEGDYSPGELERLIELGMKGLAGIGTGTFLGVHADETVAKNHFLIYEERAGWYLVNLGLNGTIVNSRRVGGYGEPGKVQLIDGSVIELDGVEGKLIFRVG